jgi:hypothetical protein
MGTVRKARKDPTMAVGVSAPTSEVGTPYQVTGGNPMAGPGALASYKDMSLIGDELESVAELQWPQSVLTYYNMRNDSHLDGLFNGTTLPIRRYNWMIDPNGCDMAKVELLAQDLNLPIKGREFKQKGRSKQRFVHDRHLYHALLSLIYGHYPMEQVGDVVDGLWRLRKLAPRPPATLQEVYVNDQGGLEYIKQMNSGQRNVGAPPIPIGRMVWYSWDMEGGNWFGRSMFRSVYRNWLMKERLLRVDSVKQERNGMGLPVAKGAPGMQKPDLIALQRQASRARAGETASVAIPYGAEMTLEGVRGALPDTVGSIKLHNEEMSRRFLMMFMQLAESAHGNRALGESFINFFQENQDVTASWYAEVTTEHVIEDWWDWNVGPEDEYTPRLVYQHSDDPRIAFADLKLMVDAGIVQVDDELEEAIRESMDLPKKDLATVRLPLAPPAEIGGQQPEGDHAGETPNKDKEGDQVTSPVAERQGRAGAGADSPAPDDRPVRREAVPA